MTTARACANIALVKYWGKRDSALNLPAAGSLSLTLAALPTTTSVAFEPELDRDSIAIDGIPTDRGAVARVSKFLDLVRERAHIATFARVISTNRFPTASGLASSASGFAALALAATRAAGLELPPRELSMLARRGSGSAARSLCGGFVEMHKGSRADGEDAFAEPLDGAQAMDVRLIVAVTSEGKKETLSTDGMGRTMETSPYYAAWVQTSEPDLADARRAIAARDLEALGVVTERSCLAMHASAMAARPAVVYFTGATIDGFRAIRKLRAGGVPAWFTCDAGPHVKALTSGKHAEAVAACLREVPGVLRVRVCAPGAAARIVE